MALTLINTLPWVIVALLIVVGYIIYSREEKKVLKKVEDEMHELFEKEFQREFVKNLKKTDRRAEQQRPGGRRSYDQK